MTFENALKIIKLSVKEDMMLSDKESELWIIFIYFPGNMHAVCTKKGSKYAAICNYMLEYAWICIYFIAILENNYSKFNNRISRKTKTIISYNIFVHLQYYQSTRECYTIHEYRVSCIVYRVFRVLQVSTRAFFKIHENTRKIVYRVSCISCIDYRILCTSIPGKM